MKRGFLFLSALVLAISLFGGLVPAQQALAQATIHVNASNAGDSLEDGSTSHPFDKIQEGINAALAGDTVKVAPGTYNENVNVAKQLTIQSTSGNPADTIVQAVNTSDHVFEVTADNVTISRLKATGATGNYYAGIYLGSGVDHCNISNNNASNNAIGIWLYSSSYNTVSNNTANSNSWCGIRLQGWGESHYNSISGNTTSSNLDGILLDCSRDNTISGNTSSNNTRGIRVRPATINSIITGSNNNTFYLNNLSSTYNVSSTDSTNTWHSPEQISYPYQSNTYTGYLGNRYSNYGGLDNGSGGRTAGDGVGDTSLPYTTDGAGDSYPLMATSDNYTLTTASVVMRLVPSTTSLIAGSTFTVNIQIEAGTQQVAGADAFINFDPTYMEVTSITPNLTKLGSVANNVVDNTNGYADYSALTSEPFTKPFPTGTFTIATVNFKCKLHHIGNTISLNPDPPRKSEVACAGESVIGNAIGCTIDQVYDVPFLLYPATNPLKIAGQQFTLTLRVAAGTQEVSGADAFINFNPLYLEAVTVTPLTSKFGTVAKNEKDNTLGYITYSALKTASQDWATGTFGIASIVFRAKLAVAVASTTITYNMAGDRTSTIAAHEGNVAYGAHADATVEIINGAKIIGSAILQGGSRPLAGLTIPLTVKLFTSDKTLDTSNILTETAAYEFTTAALNLTITNPVLSTKTITFESTAVILPATYHVSLFTPHCLINLKNNVAFAGSTTVNMGTLLEGNADDSIQITGADFALLLNDYLQTPTGLKWNVGRCDFDRTLQVTSIDFSLLTLNYNKLSPQ